MIVGDDFDEPRTTRKGFTSDALKARHAKSVRAFQSSASYFSAQRDREIQDLKFVDFDEQWEPTAKTSRAGNQSVNGLPPTPPRPALVVNQLLGPVQQLANTRRAARLALEFAPKGGGSSQDLAEVFEDIVRAIQQESRASIARNWAADRSEKAGLGWYRIDTEYSQEPSSDPAAWNDQEIVYRRILNQASVYPDAFAQEPDFSDGRRWWITEDLPLEVYRGRYPDSDLADYSNHELTAIGDPIKAWVFTGAEGSDGEESQIVRIAECWEVKETERTQVEIMDGRAAFEDEADPAMVKPSGRRRKQVKRTIEWSLMNGVEYLEEPRPWDGAYTPLIPTIGKEANVAGERRWTGLVRPSRDSATRYNVLISAQHETIGLATKAPYIGFMETIEPYLEWWKQSNVRNYFFLPLKAAYDKAGNLLPFPKRNVEEPAIQAMTIAAAGAKEDVHLTTGVPPVALGQLDPHDRSGKAIAALQGQSEIGASGYLDNLVTISMAYEGKVLRDLIPRIYDRPGRIVPAVGVDEKRRLVMLNAPYVEGPDGMPHMLPGWEEGQPAPPEIPGPPGQDGQPTTLKVNYYRLKDANLSVAPVVGKSYATRREEASAAISAVMQAIPPEMAMAIAPAWLDEQDYPGAKKIAEIAKNALPPALRAAYDDHDGSGVPAQAQAMIRQLQGQLQQAEQALQTKQVEQQGKLQITQVQESAENQRSAVDNQTQIEKAEIAAAASMANAQAKVDAENFRSYVDALDRKLDKVLALHMAAADASHEHTQNTLARTHDAAMNVLDHQQALQQGAQQGQIASDAAVQQAALTPAPDTGAES